MLFVILRTTNNQKQNEEFNPNASHVPWSNCL